MSRRRNWEYNVYCLECGHQEKSKTKNVNRCSYCGSLDLDVSDGWEIFLESYSHRREEEYEDGL
jgi:Zn finger protein HypA/HybF involved in hydrogenase expression